MKPRLSTSLCALALLLAAAPARAIIDDLPTRVITRVRGTVIAVNGNALTITDSEYKNAEREIVIGSTAAITVLNDDQSAYTAGDIPDITPGQTVTVGLAVDGVTAGSVQVMGEYVSGIIREIDTSEITIALGSGIHAKTRTIPLFSKTEFRMPDEVDGKKTTRAAERKELEAGQSVSIRMSTADRTKARLVTILKLVKKIEPATAPATLPATQPASQPAPAK